MFKKVSENVDEYIINFGEITQKKLTEIRHAIQKAIPEAIETISYKMPAYRYNGKVLIYFAGYEHHIGLYATPTGHEQFAKELSEYK